MILLNISNISVVINFQPNTKKIMCWTLKHSSINAQAKLSNLEKYKFIFKFAKF